MEREFYQKLIQWKDSGLRKPLVLRGARQVGKTYILTEFAKREYFDELYYWTSEGIAKVDFVIATERHIFPLEVKAGFSKKKKSLNIYDEKFSKEENAPIVLSRASLRNFAHDGKLVNLSFGLSSSEASDFTEEISRFSSKAIAKDAIAEKKNTKFTSKSLEYEGVKPKIQVVNYPLYAISLFPRFRL